MSKSKMIMVAGPYTASTEEQQMKNFDNMNYAAAKVLEKGHIPVVGVNAALPVVSYAKVENAYDAVMDISLALAKNCDAILMIGESTGANLERQVVENSGGTVYTSIDEIENVQS